MFEGLKIYGFLFNLVMKYRVYDLNKELEIDNLKAKNLSLW